MIHRRSCRSLHKILFRIALCRRNRSRKMLDDKKTLGPPICDRRLFSRFCLHPFVVVLPTKLIRRGERQCWETGVCKKDKKGFSVAKRDRARINTRAWSGNRADCNKKLIKEVSVGKVPVNIWPVFKPPTSEPLERNYNPFLSPFFFLSPFLPHELVLYASSWYNRTLFPRIYNVNCRMNYCER